jgi:predicted O-methyltransferase YrrM
MGEWMSGVDAKIVAMIEELDALRTTRKDHWQIPRVEGEMLHQIALAARCKMIVEIGTSYGFSGLFWAAALQQTGGKLHTIDIDPRKVESSRATFARAGLSDVVVNHQGDACRVLAEMEGPFDLVFIDADKPSCRAYFDLAWPKVSAGGSVITDNATTHKAELAEYIAYLRGRSDASSTEVAVGNGIEWTIKRGG